MAYSIAGGGTQHAKGTFSGSPTTAVSWPAAPTNGNLLAVALTFRGNATVTEATAQGWVQRSTITNGTTCQTEIWTRVAGSGETTAGPTFNIAAAVAYVIQQVEITGFAGTPTFDTQATNTGTGVSTLAVTAAATTAATDFVFGCCGDREGSTSGVTWSASTAGGGATLGADIDTTNPPKNGEGLLDTWATAGGSGTSPSITFNLSSANNTTLAACIVTFKGVAAALVYLPPVGTNYAVKRASLF